MNDTLSKVLIFVAGAAIGSVVTWKLTKTKYEQIAQEEIDSVKEVFSKKTFEPITQEPEEPESKNFETELTRNKPDLREYAARIVNLGYTDYAGTGYDPTNTEGNEMSKPYVIPPENYGDIDDYELINLTYYADGVLADDEDNIIEDVDGLIGSGSLDTFGEFQDDSVFVRNDELEQDIEIVRDLRKFSDVVGADPLNAEDEWDEEMN